MTVIIEKQKAQLLAERRAETAILAPKIESLGKVSKLSTGKEYNVTDSVSSLHS